MPTNADAPEASDRAWQGRTVLLSGATGAVGARLLDHLVAAGARVGVAVRHRRHVAGLEARLAAVPHLVAAVGTDDAEAAAGLVKGVEDSLGPIDAFLSTAGAFEAAPVGRERAGTAERLLAANFLSVATLTRAVVPPMTRRGTGGLVFTGAAAVGVAGAGMALYCASKGALHEYARCLAVELAPAGIAVTVIAPRTIDTEANRAAMPDVDRSDWVPVDTVVRALLTAARRTPDPEPALRVLKGGA